MQISCSVNKIYLFVYLQNNFAMKLCMNHLEYLKYLYKRIEISIIVF